MDEIVLTKIEGFFHHHKSQTFKKGEILIRADDDPQGIYYIQRGAVKEYAISKRGEEVIVNIFKDGAFFPMAWAMNDTHNVYYFEAVADVAVFRAPKDEVLAFIKSNPEVLYDLLSRVYMGTDGLLTRMVYLMAGRAYDRLIAEIILQAKRFGVSERETTVVHISETDLAAITGMTRETVSREMKMLKEKGLVLFERNKIIVKDLQRLEDALVESV